MFIYVHMVWCVCKHMRIDGNEHVEWYVQLDRIATMAQVEPWLCVRICRMSIRSWHINSEFEYSRKVVLQQ